MSPPTSDFETFVREGIAELRGNSSRMADALWDLIPRTKRLETSLTALVQQVDQHESVLAIIGPALVLAAKDAIRAPDVSAATHRTAPGAILVRSDKRPDSIPPQVAALGKESKSGSWTWNAEAMSTVIVGMREQLDGYEQAHIVQAALQEKAEKDAESAEKASGRLRGWLTFTLAVIIALATLFAYLAPRLGK